MLALRLVGALLLVAAAVAAVADLVPLIRDGIWQPTAMGQLWYRLHSPSLNVAQAVIQRYIHPALWDPILVWVLLQPAWAVLGLPGLLLVVLGWRRGGEGRPNRFRRS